MADGWPPHGWPEGVAGDSSTEELLSVECDEFGHKTHDGDPDRPDLPSSPTAVRSRT